MSETPRTRVHEPLPTFAGTPPFPTAARAALADDQLRTNLRRATTTIRTKRAAAVAEREDWEALHYVTRTEWAPEARGGCLASRIARKPCS